MKSSDPIGTVQARATIRPSGLFFSCLLYFFAYSLFSSYLLRVFVLFHSCCFHARVFAKTRQVPHFQQPYPPPPPGGIGRIIGVRQLGNSFTASVSSDHGRAIYLGHRDFSFSCPALLLSILILIFSSSFFLFSCASVREITLSLVSHSLQPY